MRKTPSITCIILIALIITTLMGCKNEPEPTTEPAKYKVGDVGPAGGYIFYDCDADNNTGNADGLKSSQCGWRYLEAAPADLRVVDGIPTVKSSASGYSSAVVGYEFGFYRNYDGGSSLYVNGSVTYDSSNCTGTAVGKGEGNTEKIVLKMGSSTYSNNYNSDKTENYAGRLCYILECTTIDGAIYDDWFLPSKDELNLMYVNLCRSGIGDLSGNYYWSSSEDSSNADYAWYQDFSNGNQFTLNRSYDNRRVRPVRAFQ